MGVLLPNYPQDIVVKGENVPHFGKMSGDKMRAPNGTSNVFQILGNIWKQQQAIHSQCKNLLSGPPHPPKQHQQQQNQSRQVHAHTLPVQGTSQSGPPAPCAHVHKLPQQVLKSGDSLALRKVQHPHNSRTSVNRLPLTKQEILSH